MSFVAALYLVVFLSYFIFSVNWTSHLAEKHGDSYRTWMFKGIFLNLISFVSMLFVFRLEAKEQRDLMLLIGGYVLLFAVGIYLEEVADLL